MKRILLIEPYFGGSHAKWMRDLVSVFDQDFEFDLITMPSRFWKWRMHGGAISLAQKVQKLESIADLVICTSMLDVGLFKSLLPATWSRVPIHLYFHENQFAYQWSSQDRDRKSSRQDHYHFIQYSSALVSDKFFFNSHYNRNTFLDGCEKLLKSMPDEKNLHTLEQLQSRSQVLPLGMCWEDIAVPKVEQSDQGIPTIVWNHRWEEDKNPKEFYRILMKLQQDNFNFNLILLGAHATDNQSVFNRIQKDFADKIIHVGHVASFEKYINLILKADISIVTSNQDFFGISVLETLYCQVATFLPLRLAYPEHIPAHLRKEIFYENEQELITKIKNWQNVPVKKIAESIECYDWSRLKKCYLETIFSY